MKNRFKTLKDCIFMPKGISKEERYERLAEYYRRLTWMCRTPWMSFGAKIVKRETTLAKKSFGMDFPNPEYTEADHFGRIYDINYRKKIL